MSNVQSIFSKLKKIETTDEECEILDSCEEFAGESIKFVKVLMQEHEMHLNNVRWFSSKDLLISGMTMMLVHEALIERQIQEYKDNHKSRRVIIEIESIFKRIVTHYKKTLKPFEYLIDIKECEKRILEYSF